MSRWVTSKESEAGSGEVARGSPLSKLSWLLEPCTDSMLGTLGTVSSDRPSHPRRRPVLWGPLPKP